MDPEILVLIRETVITALVVALPILLRQVNIWLSARAQDERVGGARRMLAEMARDAVASVEQTYVKPTKTPGLPGEWNDLAKLEALEKAQALVIQWLGVDGAKQATKRLGVDHGQLVEMLGSLLEAEVARRHQAVRIGIESDG